MSLNKKFLYTFFIFFLLIISLFFAFFYISYSKSLDNDEQNFMSDSSNIMKLIYDNNYMSSQIKILAEQEKITPSARLKEILSQNENAKSREIIQNLNNLYNKKYNHIQNLVKILIIGLVWVSFNVLLLWFMLRQMVLKKVNNLIFVTEEVERGNFHSRVQLKPQIFKDEFFILGSVFNQMMQSIEDNILQIKNNQYFLQSLIDTIPDGIRVIDDNYKIILANRAYLKISGQSSYCGDFCFKHSLNSDSPCPENRFLCPIKELKKQNKNHLSTIQYFANNPNLPISVNAAKMVIDDKSYIIEAIRDLSGDIKFSHQQKISSLAFLATSVAHEMKNNLGSIRMIFEQMLEDKNISKDERKYLELAHNQLLECIKIPESLLNLSKNSSEQNDVINLKSVVESVYILLDYEAKRKGIELKTSFENENITVLGNEPDYKMIFLNLCQNAIKAMPDGGNILIEASTKDRKVQISVKDTGVGIEKQNLRRIFEPFYSSDMQKNKFSGTGLGLSIVKSLIENFGGDIKVSSKKGAGTTFTINLPLNK